MMFFRDWLAFTGALLIVASAAVTVRGYWKVRRVGGRPSEADVLRWLGIGAVVALVPSLGIAVVFFSMSPVAIIFGGLAYVAQWIEGSTGVPFWLVGLCILLAPVLLSAIFHSKRRRGRSKMTYEK